MDTPQTEALSVPPDDVLFCENPEQRCPCVLLLDTSGSMLGNSTPRPIDQLNEGIRKFKEAILGDEIASRRVELSVVTFGGASAQLVNDFSLLQYIDLRELQASGSTPMGGAIRLGLDLIKARKKAYRQNGIPFYRPWMFIITDGEPTDEGWESAVHILHQYVEAKGVTLFVVGVEPANMEILNCIAHKSRSAVRLKSQKNSFRELFAWLSASLSAVSSSNDQAGQLKLTNPCGWAEVPLGSE